MQKLKLTNLVLLVVLSIASGVAKVMKLPDELEFFQQAGFSELGLVLFGVVQLLAGLLISFTKSRKIAAITLATTYIVSTLLIFMSGNLPFGVFSLLPVVMCGFVIKSTSLTKTPE